MNKPAKDYLRKQFHKWYAKVKDQLENGKNPDEACVDVKKSEHVGLSHCTTVVMVLQKLESL